MTEQPAPAYKPSPQLLQLAESILQGVTTGAITSFAVVKVGPFGQFNGQTAGGQVLEILTGAEVLRDDLKAAIRGQGRPAIVRARG